MSVRNLGIAVGAAVLACAAPLAAAQPYPARPVRLIVPFPPGGIADNAARSVAQQLSERLGQQFILDNRGGGNTIIGTNLAAKAAPDGYTLVSVPFNFGANPSLYKDLPYDSAKDLTPVALLGLAPNFLLVHPSVPARNVKELIQLARADPSRLNFGTGGAGSSNHLAGELFKQAAHIEMRHVPYKGAGAAGVALLAGEVSVSFSAVSSVAAQIQAGRLRALAITSSRRSPAFSQVPTMAEEGIADCEVSAWHGFMAPAGTPRDIVLKLNGETVHALRVPEVVERFKAAGFEPRPGSPEDFGRFIQAELQKWARVIRAAHISVAQ